MPRTETIKRKIYSFDELEDRAKEKARDWWRDMENRHGSPDDFECVIDDAVRMGKLMGIVIETKPVKLMGGGTREKPVIYWSLGYCQSDGASFDAWYSYQKGAVKAVTAECPKDTKLHQIAKDLAEAQRRAFYRLEAKVTAGRHDGYIGVVVTRSDTGNDASEGDSSAIEDALNGFASWIYDQCRGENDYRMSKENVDESIRANGYEFDELGGII
jgi:hypothetical protein